jgi:hypothetical protein
MRGGGEGTEQHWGLLTKLLEVKTQGDKRPTYLQRNRNRRLDNLAFSLDHK